MSAFNHPSALLKFRPFSSIENLAHCNSFIFVSIDKNGPKNGLKGQERRLNSKVSYINAIIYLF
jgi:hypothetical protein